MTIGLNDLPAWSMGYERLRIELGIPVAKFNRIIQKSGCWWSLNKTRNVPPRKWPVYMKRLNRYFAKLGEE